MIYPEYTETDDLRNIEGFVKILQDTLEQTGMSIKIMTSVGYC